MSNNFHLIRYVLAVLVLYSHSFGLLKLPEPGLFQDTFGSFAVKCFFALSGYLITLSCLRSAHLGHYILNRSLRIAPALIVALIASHFIGIYFKFFISNPVPYITNGPVWTLPWEVLCYTLCGVLWWAGLLNKNALGAVVAVSWLIFVVLPGSGDTNAVIAPLLLLFFMGSLIALDEKQFNVKISGPLFGLLLIGIVVDTTQAGISFFFKYIPFMYGPGLIPQRYYYFLYIFSLPFVLIWLALYIKPLFNLRNDYSYGMYVFGWPVQQMIIAFFSPPPITLFVTSLVVTHCFAMLSWHLIEKRMLMLKH